MYTIEDIVTDKLKIALNRLFCCFDSEIRMKREVIGIDVGATLNIRVAYVTLPIPFRYMV